MIPRFALVRPTSLPEALAARAALGDDGAWLAGGTELLQVMKMGFAQIGTLVEIARLPELAGILRDADGGLTIGAAVTHRQIERSPLVRESVPALALLETGVANVRVRNTGTIGGNLAFAEPHSDPATFLLACDARLEISGPEGTRTTGLDGFLLGPLATTLEPLEILRAIRIPPAAAGEGRAYAKIAFFERPAASVAIRLRVVGGRIAAATVAVGSMTDVPILIPLAAAALAGAEATSEALSGPLDRAAEALDALDVVPDLSGSADFKRHLAGVLLRRAARAALSEALARA